MRTYKEEEITLQYNEKRFLQNGGSPYDTKTYARAQIYFIEKCKALELEGKKVDYSLEGGKVKTRLWFDEKELAFKMLFCYEQFEINMREVESDIIADIENWWEKKKHKKHY